MVGQTSDDAYGDTHVCSSQNVVEYQRTSDTIGQRLVVFVHLLIGQCVVSREGCYDDVSTQGGINLGLADLFTEAVACQSGIYQDASVGSLYCCVYEDLSVALADAVAFARCAHEQGRHLIVGKEVDDSLDGFHVESSILCNGGYHWYHHAAIFALVHITL